MARTTAVLARPLVVPSGCEPAAVVRIDSGSLASAAGTSLVGGAIAHPTSLPQQRGTAPERSKMSLERRTRSIAYPHLGDAAGFEIEPARQEPVRSPVLVVHVSVDVGIVDQNEIHDSPELREERTGKRFVTRQLTAEDRCVSVWCGGGNSGGGWVGLTLYGPDAAAERHMVREVLRSKGAEDDIDPGFALAVVVERSEKNRMRVPAVEDEALDECVTATTLRA